MNNLVLRATCFAQSLAAVSKDRRGVTAMEYGLIAALVAVVIIVAVDSVGTQLDITFDNIATALTSANAKAP
jgi:pilus assembly protein Flp/PilA